MRGFLRNIDNDVSQKVPRSSNLFQDHSGRVRYYYLFCE